MLTSHIFLWQNYLVFTPPVKKLPFLHAHEPNPHGLVCVNGFLMGRWLRPYWFSSRPPGPWWKSRSPADARYEVRAEMRWWGSRSAGTGSKPTSPDLLPWVCSVEESWLILSLRWIDRVVKWSHCLTAVCCCWSSYSSWLLRLRCVYFSVKEWTGCMFYILAIAGGCREGLQHFLLSKCSFTFMQLLLLKVTYSALNYIYFLSLFLFFAL